MKEKIFLDTNVVIDLLGEREPFYSSAAKFASNFYDFEDSLQYFCAIKMNCNLIITRNVKDYKESDIPVLTPDEYLNSNKTIKKYT